MSTWVFYCFELCFQINVKKTLIASRTKEGLKSSKLYFKFCILEARIVKKVCKKQPERNNVVHKIFSVYSSSIFYIRTKSIFGIKCEIFITIHRNTSKDFNHVLTEVLLKFFFIYCVNQFTTNMFPNKFIL